MDRCRDDREAAGHGVPPQNNALLEATFDLFRGKLSATTKKEWFKDRIDEDGRNKSLHEWQQGVGEAEQIIEYFTFEGDLVVDPFLGSGTNGVASKKLKRRFVGCDIDEKAVGTALNRISESS